MQSATDLRASQMWLCRLHDVFQLPTAEQTIILQRSSDIANPPDDVMKEPDVRLPVDQLHPDRLKHQPGFVPRVKPAAQGGDQSLRSHLLTATERGKVERVVGLVHPAQVGHVPRHHLPARAQHVAPLLLGRLLIDRAGEQVAGALPLEHPLVVLLGSVVEELLHLRLAHRRVLLLTGQHPRLLEPLDAAAEHPPVVAVLPHEETILGAQPCPCLTPPNLTLCQSSNVKLVNILQQKEFIFGLIKNTVSTIFSPT